MPFKGTRHGDGVVDGAVAKRLQLWQHVSSLWRHAVWIRIVTSHNAWMGYEYSSQNMNRPRAIHKHDPHPLETRGVCDNICTQRKFFISRLHNKKKEQITKDHRTSKLLNKYSTIHVHWEKQHIWVDVINWYKNWFDIWLITYAVLYCQPSWKQFWL